LALYGLVQAHSSEACTRQRQLVSKRPPWLDVSLGRATESSRDHWQTARNGRAIVPQVTGPHRGRQERSCVRRSIVDCNIPWKQPWATSRIRSRVAFHLQNTRYRPATESSAGIDVGQAAIEEMAVKASCERSQAIQADPSS
jgi:hypothetical protein